jgi:TonB family protein
MSATPQVGHDPIELMRTVVSQLRSSNGGLGDKGQISQLLAEAQAVLEHANVIDRATSQCQEFLAAAEFDKAFEALDAGLLAYPDDPALIAYRKEVESRQNAFQTAASARTALEEADWFVGQNRTDLAVQLLKEKAGELSNEALTQRLHELEALLPQWERSRNVQLILSRAAALEQAEQWEAALTILEEALQSYGESEELAAVAKRLRDRVVGHERQMKLARRQERMRQQIAAQSWRPALALLKSTQAEFPGAPELDALRSEINAGLKRAELESTVTEVRQFLADGELEEAEKALTRGRKSLGPDPAFDGLQQELESGRHYREELREAQICFGRRRLEDAERILVSIAGPDRPEALNLLSAVKQAQAATEEENFFERGREKALALMQQQQFAQAADLLSNLLSLFPGDPILERDLALARNGLLREAPPIPTPVAEEEPDPLPPSSAVAPHGAEHPARSSRMRRVAISGTASLLLITATGAVLKRARSAPPPATAVAKQPVVEMAQPAGPATAAAAEPIAKSSPSSMAVTTIEVPLPATEPRRPFTAPQGKAVEPVPNPTLPPAAEPGSTAEPVRSLPAGLSGPGKAPALPPPPPQEKPAAPAPAVPEKPPLPVGGKLKEARIVSSPMPDYPDLARRMGIHGEVRLEVTLDDSGSVTGVKILSGHPILATAAKNAVLKWKYLPAMLNDRPVTSTMALQVRFVGRDK